MSSRGQKKEKGGRWGMPPLPPKKEVGGLLDVGGPHEYIAFQKGGRDGRPGDGVGRRVVRSPVG